MRTAGQLSPHAADRALASVLKRQIVLHHDDELHVRALDMAATCGLPAAYDAHYLALAARLGVELWTTDAKLVRAVEDRLAWVRLVS
jgi:predicted nucleic acid-binding protein